MSIESRRTQKLVRDIIYDYIAKGEYPPIHVVLHEMGKRKEQEATAIQPIIYRGVIRSSPVNDTIDKITATIALIYEELYDLYQKYSSFFQDARQDYKRLALLEKKLTTMLDDIMHASTAANDYFYSWGDSFNDLTKIDETLTTTQIRLEAGEAHLHTQLHISKEASLNDIIVADPTVVVENPDVLIRSREKDPITNAFDGDLATCWCHEVETAMNTPTELHLNISTSLQNINHVEVEPYTIGPVQISAFASMEGERVQWGTAKTTSGRVSFGGYGVGVSALTILFSKDHHDLYEHGDFGARFSYLFGAYEITIRHEVYDTFGEVVSIPIELPASLIKDYNLTSASIEVNESTPSGTGIAYFLGTEPEGGAEDIDDIIWDAISPANLERQDETIPKTVFFSPGNAITTIIEPEDIDTAISEIKNDVIIYRINHSGDEDILLDSLEVYEGWNQSIIWKEDTIEEETLSLDHWVNRETAEDIYKGYINIGELGSLYLHPEESYLIETKLFSSGNQTIHTHVTKPREWKIKYYLNGEECPFVYTAETRGELTLEITEGENYLHTTLITDPANTSMQLGVSLSKYGDIYIDKPYVTDYDQIFNTPIATKYAAWNKGVVINHDLDTEAFIGATPYGFSSYDNVFCKPRVMINYYRQGSSEGKAIRFRAHLWRLDDVEATPQLKEYHVRIKYRSD